MKNGFEKEKVMIKTYSMGIDARQLAKIVTDPILEGVLEEQGKRFDFRALLEYIAAAPEIDETEAVAVLSDEPEDPEEVIETLNKRILYLEAELEERRRATDLVLAALRPLGTIEKLVGGYQTYLEPEQPSEALEAQFGPQGTTSVATFDTNLPPAPFDWEKARLGEQQSATAYATAQAGAKRYLATEQGRRY
jgi:hypothetical protein